MLKLAIGKEFGSKLLKYDIDTPEKFLTTSCHEICHKLNISMSKYEDLKYQVIQKWSQISPLITVEQLSRQNSSTPKHVHISTGINSLDKILDGGFLKGSVTEICGMHGSGKSNLCMHISLRILVNSYNMYKQ